MAIMLLSSHCIEIGQVSMPAMNFNQPGRYPSSAYTPYLCAVRVSEAVDLLKPQMDDVFFSMRQDVEERLQEQRSISEIERKLISENWPDWRSLSAPWMAQVLAQESAMDILLELTARHSSGRPIAQLRTADTSVSRGCRIVIKGRAVFY
jgi:hypothetical protein